MERTPLADRLHPCPFRHKRQFQRNPAPLNTLALRWNGKKWAIVSNPGSRNQLMGAAVSQRRLWAVGTYDNGNRRTLVVRSSS